MRRPTMVLGALLVLSAGLAIGIGLSGSLAPPTPTRIEAREEALRLDLEERLSELSARIDRAMAVTAGAPGRLPARSDEPTMSAADGAEIDDLAERLHSSTDRLDAATAQIEALINEVRVLAHVVGSGGIYGEVPWKDLETRQVQPSLRDFQSVKPGTPFGIVISRIGLPVAISGTFSSQLRAEWPHPEAGLNPISITFSGGIVIKKYIEDWQPDK